MCYDVDDIYGGIIYGHYTIYVLYISSLHGARDTSP